MAQDSSGSSSFDKNLRSLLEAVSMLEREAGLLLDRFGLDTATVGRVLDTLGNLSIEAIRPLAAAVGIADASALEALARDVRALLQSEARLRRQQEDEAARLQELVAAVSALGETTAGLAELQARTRERLDALALLAEEAGRWEASRTELRAQIEALQQHVQQFESRVVAEMGLDGAQEAEAGVPAAVRAGAVRRAPRPLPAATGSAKILEGFPQPKPRSTPT